MSQINLAWQPTVHASRQALLAVVLTTGHGPTHCNVPISREP